jgi:hypothetical protein
MYSIGDGVKEQDIVTLTEDHDTLEYLLRLIDPVKDTPTLNWDRLAGTLQAAEKYQIDSVFKWFEREVSFSLNGGQYPTLPNPMLYFALARRYELRTTGRLALRQLIKCPISEIMGNPYVDSSLLKHIINLRVERTQKMVEVINLCPDYPYQEDDKCYEHPDNYMKDRKWKVAATQAIIAEPRWSAVVSSIENKYGKKSCRCIVLGNAKVPREMIRNMETKLPELDW